MNIKKIVTSAFVTCLLCSGFHAFANQVEQIRSNSMENKVQIVVDTTDPPILKAFALSNPTRLVVDVDGFPSSHFSNNLTFRHRGVSKVRTGLKNGNKVRVVLELVKNFRWKAYAAAPGEGKGHRVVIDVFDHAGRTPVRTLAQAKLANTTYVPPADIVPNISSTIPDVPVSPTPIMPVAPADGMALSEAQVQNMALATVSTPSNPVNSIVDTSSGSPVVSGLNNNMGIDTLVSGTNVRTSSRMSGTATLSPEVISEPPVSTITGDRNTLFSDKSATIATPTPTVMPVPQPKVVYENTAPVAVTVPPVYESTPVSTNSQSIFSEPNEITFDSNPNVAQQVASVVSSNISPSVSSIASAKIVVPNETLTYEETPIVESEPAPSSSIFSAPRKIRQKDFLIMIDPGHGGKDSGAVGPMGTQEKRIVLQIAKRLKRRINSMPGMRAILTRSSDRYITLRGRLALARRHKPDLFVSIHADAARNRSARGSSIYVLSNRGASSEAAKILAQNENAVDAKYGMDISGLEDEVGNVMVKMQQDATIESSHKLAKTTLRQLRNVGSVHKHHVERAAFAVLKSPSIPSMLVETAFISNYDEEQKLRSASYQNQLASAIARGVKRFLDTHSTQSEMVANSR